MSQFSELFRISSAIQSKLSQAVQFLKKMRNFQFHLNKLACIQTPQRINHTHFLEIFPEEQEYLACLVNTFQTAKLSLFPKLPKK